MAAVLDPLVTALLPVTTTKELVDPLSSSTKMSVITPTTATPVVVTTTPVQNPATPVSSSVLTTSKVSSTSSVSSNVLSTSSASSTSLISSTATSTTSTTSTAPTSTSLKPTTTSTTSTTSSTPVVTITSTSSVPALISTNVSSSSSSVSAAAGNSSSSGIGGSGLSVGALAGIIAGGVVVLVAIAVIATRSIRKKQREKRTRRRSAMMEPWATGGMDDDPAWEKPRYEAPSQSYQMHDTSYPPAEHYSNEPTYPNVEETYNNPSYVESHLPQAAYPVGSSHGHEYGAAESYPAQDYSQLGNGASGYQEYPVDPANVYQETLAAPLEGNAAGYGAGAGVAPLGAEVPPPAGGLRDGSMVRVKVGFVRSLEDELAISPGQQLYLHSMYDDGWSLCEDQQGNRGVVPLSCLEPWQDTLGPSGHIQSNDPEFKDRAQRRSSLYQNAQAAGAYLNMPQP